MSKIHVEALKCDRCGVMGIPDKTADYRGPKSYTLTDHALRGGPVLDLCRACRKAVEDFARGVGVNHAT